MDAPGEPEPSPAPGGTGGPHGDRRLPLVGIALVFYGVLLGLAWGWSFLAGTPIGYASEAARQSGVALGRDLGLGALAAAVVIWLSWELTRRTGWGTALARELAAVLGRVPLRDCILLALASGIAEEVFFRGVLQPRVGLVAASLLFGLAHFVPRRELLPWTGFSVAAGLLLGGLFEATGNLVAPVTAHVLVNAVNLRILAVRYAPPA